ncbi:hypothetical protein DVH02_09700 [Streptomyces corynorhini]|uniref:GerMN domain-containing protein n=1 Tax=Streptomyces corynorhini TaxID=2282652 RepID=A0A370B9L5_9ACTN|nr:hypothetical protein DVH02_09700 [Streptomyces corynorhini]
MRAARASALLITVLALLSGCRIPTTGVVEVGEPATGVRAATYLFFVRDGELLPVLRTGDGAPPEVAEAVELVYLGPTEEEAHQGVSTELTGAIATGTLPRTVVKGDAIFIEVPARRMLSALAVLQLSCTAYAARLVAEPAATGTTVAVADATRRTDPRPGRELCPAPGRHLAEPTPADGAGGPSAIPAPTTAFG